MMLGWSWSYLKHNLGKSLRLDSSKAEKELGIKFTAVDTGKSYADRWWLTMTTAITEMAEALIQQGVV